MGGDLIKVVVWGRIGVGNGVEQWECGCSGNTESW